MADALSFAGAFALDRGGRLESRLPLDSVDSLVPSVGLGPDSRSGALERRRGEEDRSERSERERLVEEEERGGLGDFRRRDCFLVEDAGGGMVPVDVDALGSSLGAVGLVVSGILEGEEGERLGREG